MNPLQRFADRLHRQTGCNFFVRITYNPGRRLRGLRGFARVESFVAQPYLQRVEPNGHVENIPFEFVREQDTLDQMGTVFGHGASASRAFTALLRNIAGKPLATRVGGRRPMNITVPRDAARWRAA